MIKCENLGMLDIAKINPVLTSASDVNNNSFLVGADGITYVIMNDISGDDAYKDDVTLKAGSYLNGYDVSAWVGQKLIVDGKHITGGVSGLTAGTSVLVIDGDHPGMLKAGSGSAGDIIFKVTQKLTLTEAAVKVQIAIASGE